MTSRLHHEAFLRTFATAVGSGAARLEPTYGLNRPAPAQSVLDSLRV